MSSPVTNTIDGRYDTNLTIKLDTTFPIKGTSIEIIRHININLVRCFIGLCLFNQLIELPFLKF